MAFADRFLVRNSLYVTSAIAVCIVVYMAFNWEAMPVTQRIIGLYYVLIAAHEWEELKFPGGFVEQAYLPDGLVNSRFYLPSPNGEEPRLAQWWRRVKKIRDPD